MVFAAGMKAVKEEFERSRNDYKSRIARANLKHLDDQNYTSGYKDYKPKTRKAWLLHRLLLHIEGTLNVHESEEINQALSEIEKDELFELLRNQTTEKFEIKSELDDGRLLGRNDIINVLFPEELQLFVLSSLMKDDSAEYYQIRLRLAQRYSSNSKTLNSKNLQRPID